jgi:chorismate synthase
MTTLRYLTAGESHGRALVGLIEGIPAGLALSAGDIDRDLKRRQTGHGRGGRMSIESDHAEILSGVRWGKTLGSPITLLIRNKDYKNWLKGMSPEPEADGSIPALVNPRPGHADLSGAMKYDQHDMRNILERSSARETAVRVALGAVAKKFLSEFDIMIGSYVIQIGEIGIQGSRGRGTRGSSESSRTLESLNPRILASIFRKAEKSPVRCPDDEGSTKMIKLIDRAMKEGNSLGGTFEVFVIGAPAGLGSHIQWDKRLDGRLGQALMSIQAIKGVEIGAGFEMSKRFGSEVMDEIFYESSKSKVRSPEFYRKTNNAGGIEGGVTNGMPVILRAAMKPIPTLRKPLRSVDVVTKKKTKAAYERSDICAAPAAAVIGEAMVALTLANAFIEKFGGDSMREIKRNHDSYIDYIGHF